MDNNQRLYIRGYLRFSFRVWAEEYTERALFCKSKDPDFNPCLLLTCSDLGKVTLPFCPSFLNCKSKGVCPRPIQTDYATVTWPLRSKGET